MGTALKSRALTFGKKPPRNLPSEPLQSLFMDDEAGRAAIQRVESLVTAGAQPFSAASIAELSAMTEAAYPALLLDRQQHPPPLQRPLPQRGAPAKPDAIETRDLLRRISKLRINWNQFQRDLAPPPPPPPPPPPLPRTLQEVSAEYGSVEELMEGLALDGSKLQFYVPFGFGERPPPLVYPPAPPVMFGSVPVWIDDLVHVLYAFTAPRLALGAPRRIRTLEPSLECSRGEDGVVHPTVISLTKDGMRCSFFADYIPPDADGGRLPSVAHSVTSLAWTTERVLQSTLLAHAHDDGIPPLDFRLLLPTPSPRLPNGYEFRALEREVVANTQRAIRAGRGAMHAFSNFISYVLTLPFDPSPPDTSIYSRRTFAAEYDHHEDFYIGRDPHAPHAPSASSTGVDVRFQENLENMNPAERADRLGLVDRLKAFKENNPTDVEILTFASLCREYLDIVKNDLENKKWNDAQWNDSKNAAIKQQAFLRARIGVKGKMLEAAVNIAHDRTSEPTVRAKLNERKQRFEEYKTAEKEAHKIHRRRIGAAGLLGMAMARSVLGHDAPDLNSIVSWPDDEVMEQNEFKFRVQELHDTLKANQDDANTRVSALRLGEACAITHYSLVS